MREPKLKEKVRIKNDISNTVYIVKEYCLGLVTVKEDIKGSRNKKDVILEDIVFIEEEKLSISKHEKGQILKDLIFEDSLKENFLREIILLAKLIKKFPHRDFWVEGFKPALKVNSLSYWYNRPETEELYKKWSVDLSSKVEKIELSKEKFESDYIPEKRKPKNLLELLG